MTDITRFRLSPKFIETILDNNFGMPNENYKQTDIYIGLGIEFDEETFSFSKEPVKKGFTILNTPVSFSEPINGIIRNDTALTWDKAKENWTNGDEKIQYIGLYYKNTSEESDSHSGDTDYADKLLYELIGILPLVPAETVLINEKMVLNPSSIQIRLNNR